MSDIDYDADDNEPEAIERRAPAEEEILEAARERFRVAVEAWSKQREREREDLKFAVPELQWDEEARRQRLGTSTTPGRPTLSISKIDQPLQLVMNQMRAANLGVNIHPIGEDASDDTAEMLQGLYRHIERTSRAELARSWSFDRARSAGLGAYRVNKVYDDEGGRPSDQKIEIKRILHQDGVYFDPTAQEPDFSDGRYVFIVSRVTRGEFRRKYGKESDGINDQTEWDDLLSEAPEWFQGDDVLVAEYWYKETASEKFVVEVDGETIAHERERDTVYCAHVCGWRVLEQYEWEGKYIPIIPVIGRELQPFDSERIWYGMIRPARDGQRLYNFAASSLVERMALEPKAPFILAEGQEEGHEAQWRSSNTSNFPYLLYKPTTVAGQQAPPPARAQIDQSGMSLAMMALQEADAFIQATTAVFDPSLGKLPQKERSGRAIQALQSQSDAGTSHYLQNLADISMTYEAKVILDLIPKVYDRPGRITRIVRGDDDSTEVVMLNRRFAMDPQTGRPVPMAPGQQPQGAKVKNYDLAKGVYSTSVNIGKSFQTRLEQGANEMGEILAAEPSLMPMLGDLYFRFRDFPGAKEIADRLAKIREKQFPGLGEGEDGAPTPEQTQAKMQAMQQQLQQAQQLMQEMQKALDTDQAKHQATIQTKQMEMSARVQIERMKNATSIAVARISAAKETMNAAREDEEEAIALALDQQHEADQADRDRAHEVAMAAAGGRTMNMQRDMGQEHDNDVSTGEPEAPQA